MCSVLGCHDTRPCLAVDLGVAMQLTNIARDVLMMPEWGGVIYLLNGLRVNPEQIVAAADGHTESDGKRRHD